MNTENLANLLMEKQRWNYEQLAGECGISRQVLHRLLHTKPKTKRRTGFHLGVIASAFKNGLEAEALSVILGSKKGSSSTLRAAIIYPDLTPEELGEIKNAENVTHMSPLPSEVIRSIVEAHRFAKTQKHIR